MKNQVKITLDHPRDRKVRMLHKKQKRQQRLSAQKRKLDYQANMNYLRAAWFRQQCITLGYTITSVPTDILAALVLLFIHRNDDEIKELQAQRNPKYGRIRQLQAVRQSQLDAVKSAKGLHIPKLSCDKDVQTLTTIWDGLPQSMAVIQLEGFTTQDLEKFSSHMQSLRHQIKSIFAIRQEALTNLKRSVKKNVKQVSNKRQITNSVKKVDYTAYSVKSRMRKNLAQQQRSRQIQARHAALAQKREDKKNDVDL